LTEDILARGMPAADDTSTAAELTRQHLAGVLSKERVEAEVALALFAGTNTTSGQLMSILVLLAQHPEWQDQVVEELHAAGRRAARRVAAGE
jgi:cytochrome P450